MASTEAGPKIVDLVTAELVERQPEPETATSVCPQPETAADSPVRRAAEATIEQTGADPPPMESR